MADRSGTEITEYHSYMYAESQGTRYVTSLDDFTATYCTAQYYYSITTVDSVHYNYCTQLKHFSSGRSESRPSYGHLTSDEQDREEF